VALVIGGEPSLRYMQATAAALHDPRHYIGTVLAAQPVPPPERAAAQLPGAPR
jgi:multicomponent K+:H+ antiporter subunit D